MVVCCGMAVKKMQMLAVNVRKRKVLTVKRDNDNGKGRQNLTYYVFKCMKLIVKYFFLADILFMGVPLY